MVETAAYPNLHVAGLDTVDLGEFKPKPTGVSGDPMERSKTLWKSPDGTVMIGVWECTPGTFTATREGYSEVAHITRGKFSLTTPDGVTTEHGPDDLVVTNEGWRGTWVITETVRKVWVIQRKE
jgi:uncharacterized cupin superfamily protein